MTWLRVLCINGVAGAIFWCLWRGGYLATAAENDILYIIPAIGVTAAFGWVQIWRDAETAHWCADSCVALGLLGTALGIWTAFSGIDPSMVGDVAQIGAVLGVLLTGLGAALWTTMAGLTASLWLSANIRATGA